jgi:hypothetical protein
MFAFISATTNVHGVAKPVMLIAMPARIPFALKSAQAAFLI